MVAVHQSGLWAHVPLPLAGPAIAYDHFFPSSRAEPPEGRRSRGTFLSMHQQKRSLHYASLRSAPVGMTVFRRICDSLPLAATSPNGASTRKAARCSAAVTGLTPTPRRQAPLHVAFRTASPAWADYAARTAGDCGSGRMETLLGTLVFAAFLLAQVTAVAARQVDRAGHGSRAFDGHAT